MTHQPDLTRLLSLVEDLVGCWDQENERWKQYCPQAISAVMGEICTELEKQAIMYVEENDDWELLAEIEEAEYLDVEN